MVKRYPEAQNHLLIGEVLNRDAVSVELNFRTVHFGRAVNGPRDIRLGEIGVRVVPWLQILIINVLSGDLAFGGAELTFDGRGNFAFNDLKHACPIVIAREFRH